MVRFKELAVDEKPNGCVVCVGEFEAYEEIRGLVFCQHIFNQECLDRWMDHDQQTCMHTLCSQCRTPLAMKKMEKGASPLI